MLHVSRITCFRLFRVHAHSSCGRSKTPFHANRSPCLSTLLMADIYRQLSAIAPLDPTVLHTESKSKSLHLIWSDQRTSQFHWNWLRDHCQKATDASKLKTSALNLSPPKTKPTKVAIVGSALEIIWGDGLRSIYPLDWLRQNDYSVTAQKNFQQKFAPVTWNKEEFQNHGMPTYEYRSILENERILYRLLSDVNLLGIAVIKQSGTEENTLYELASKMASENFTIYEGVRNVTLTASEVQFSEHSSPHQDMCYYESPPGIQVVHCLSTNGEAKFLDGFRLAQDLKRNNLAHFQLFSRLRQPFESIGDRHHFLCLHPIIGVYNSEVKSICWSPSHEGILNVYSEFVEIYYEAKRSFSKMTDDPKYAIHHSMQPGEMIVVNNRRILHAYRTNAEFCKYRCMYIDIDHYLSRLHELALENAEKHDVIHQCGQFAI